MAELNKVSVVIGAQFGDEGKGKTVDMLSQTADIVCRCQGGNNAGHTVVVGENTYYFHLLPSGIVNENCIAVIGNGVVVHLPNMFKEIEKNEKKGMVEWEKRLKLSSRAHLVFDFHQTADALQEALSGEKSVGTTKKGIGPTYSSKTTRNGIRIADLVGDFSVFEEKFRTLADYMMIRYPDLKVDVQAELNRYKGYREQIKPLVIDTVTFMHNALKDTSKTILVEGANATMLDIDFGTYPMVTSSNCTIGGVCTGLGIPPHRIGNVYGIVKAYLTRVGNGCVPTELNDEIGDYMQATGNELGVTTGRKRRCGWLDMVMLKYASMINGFTAIALNKLDILDGLEEVKIGVAYRIDGKLLEHVPGTMEELARVDVDYLTMPGWKQNTHGTKKFKDLPQKAQDYVLKIQELLGVPVRWIGVGQPRDFVIEMF